MDQQQQTAPERRRQVVSKCSLSQTYRGKSSQFYNLSGNLQGHTHSVLVNLYLVSYVKSLHHTRLEVFTVVRGQINVFSVATPCCLGGSYKLLQESAASAFRVKIYTLLFYVHLTFYLTQLKYFCLPRFLLNNLNNIS